MFPFEIIDVTTLNFSYDNPEVDLEKSEDYENYLGVGRSYNDEEEYITFLVNYWVENEESKKIFEIGIGVMFSLEDYSVVTNKEENGNFVLPEALDNMVMGQLFAICHGVVSAKSEGLKVAEAVYFPLYNKGILSDDVVDGQSTKST